MTLGLVDIQCEPGYAVATYSQRGLFVSVEQRLFNII